MYYTWAWALFRNIDKCAWWKIPEKCSKILPIILDYFGSQKYNFVVFH